MTFVDTAYLLILDGVASLASQLGSWGGVVARHRPLSVEWVISDYLCSGRFQATPYCFSPRQSRSRALRSSSRVERPRQVTLPHTD